MNLTRERVVKVVREVVLSIGAVLGILAILVAIGSIAFGLRPLVFRSGSMAPTIKTGALAISHQVGGDDLRVGQIVSVPTDAGDRVTHRIVKVEHEPGGVALLTLRGDANAVDDAQTYRVTSADKVLFSVPQLGYLIAWMSGSTGRFVLGIYAAFLLMVLFRKPEKTEDVSDADDTVAREGALRGAVS